MKVDTLEQLGVAFTQWRKQKRHRREPTPEVLVKRAGAAARLHGLGRVMQVVKIDGRRLRKGPGRGARRGEAGPSVVPAYSRIQVAAPSFEAARPFAELELPSGVRLRLYSGAPETMQLLSSVCSVGVGR
jgi:hypothetical protein